MMAWVVARGLHRRVFTYGVLAAGLGLLAGIYLHTLMIAGTSHASIACTALGFAALIWPLASIATFRIARPLRELAAIAGDLQDGKLDRRAAIADAPGEVGEVGTALREMADRVARQLKDQRALMAAVSHELRSPLGRARVLVEMAREGSAPPTLHDDLEAEIAAMDGLVGDLLAAARIDFEAVSPRELDVRDLVGRAVQIAGVGRIDFDGDPGTVRADATLIARALAGLLDNARRYGGTAVVLRVRDRGELVRFDVDDDGPGFAPGDEERAFTPFWRGPPGEGPPPRGEGLGLALVRQIAQAHHGTAGAGNRPEGGARVWIELPR
jgi:signal transduction histidine kinase